MRSHSAMALADIASLLDPAKGYRATWTIVESPDKKSLSVSISWTGGSIKFEARKSEWWKVTMTLDKKTYILEGPYGYYKDTIRRVKLDIEGVKYEGKAVLTKKAPIEEVVIEFTEFGQKLEITTGGEKNQHVADFSVDSVSKFNIVSEDKSTPNAHIREGILTLNFGSFQAVRFNISFNIDKNDWSKFKVNFDVMEATNTLISLSGNTIDSPYLFSFSSPYLFQLINASQNPITMTINPGGSVFTDTRLKNPQTLINGDFVTVTITSREQWTSPDIFLNNEVHVNLDGTNIKLDITLDWVVNKVEDLHLKLTAVGETPNLGNFSISRDLKFGLDRATNKFYLDMIGYAEFSAEALAPFSPIQSELKLSFDNNKPSTDLSGKLIEVFGGNSYVLFDVSHQM